jgi:hypothetical protein
MKVVPAAKILATRTVAPQVRNTPTGCVVKHRELVTSVNGVTSGDYTINTLELNPGLPLSFPWLSGVADNFQLYRFKRLAVEYVTRVGYDAVGSFMSGFKYDVDQEPPATEQQFMAHSGCKEDVVYSFQAINLDVKRFHAGYEKRFVREVMASDLDKYDGAYFMYATEGTAVSTVLGKLWVSYEVEFFSPQSVAHRQPTKFGDKAVYCVDTPPAALAAGSEQLVTGTVPEYNNIRPLVHDAALNKWTAQSPMRVRVETALQHKSTANNVFIDAYHFLKKNAGTISATINSITSTGAAASPARAYITGPSVIDLDTGDELEIWQGNGSGSGSTSILDGARSRIVFEIIKTGLQMLADEGGPLPEAKLATATKVTQPKVVKHDSRSECDSKFEPPVPDIEDAQMTYRQKVLLVRKLQAELDAEDEVCAPSSKELSQ